MNHYKLSNRQDFNLEENVITVLLEDRQANLWVGTHHGLYRREAKTGRFYHYASVAGDPTSLSHPEVEAICTPLSSEAKNMTKIMRFCLLEP